MATVEIKKIEIKIDKKIINLSLEQAKELKFTLDNLFQKAAYYPYYPAFRPDHIVEDFQWPYTTTDYNTSGGTVFVNIRAEG